MGSSFHEELSIEDGDDALDQIDSLVEDCRNRLTFKNLRLPEAYVKGNLIIQIPLRSNINGEQFDAIFKALPPWTLQKEVNSRRILRT